MSSEVLIAKRFKLGRRIGSGSFGEIYSAIDIQANREVAVKIVHSYAGADQYQASTARH